MNKKILILFAMMIFLITGCSSLSFKNNTSVIGNTYTLISPYVDSSINISFKKEMIFGFSGVNNFFGNYTVKKNIVKFGPLGSTLMAGPMDKMEKEKYILSILNNSNKLTYENNNIIITSKDNKSLTFKFSEKFDNIKNK
ncbi:MAG: META domain-containing protein [Fusobacteriaceae bacterium]